MTYPPFERALVSLSLSDNLEAALREWENIGGYRKETTCICGQNIVNVALYRNVRNGNEAEIGCDCVSHFSQILDIDDPFDFSIFAVLKGSRRLVYSDLKELVKMKLIEPVKLDDKSDWSKWLATFRAAYKLKLKIRKPPLASECDRSNSDTDSASYRHL